MRKLLLGSAVLTFFAISITLFQISCQQESIAQTTTYTLPPATTTTLGGVIVGTGLTVNSSGVLSATSSGNTQLNKIVFVKYNSSIAELWTANYDGTNQTKINITLPAGNIITGEGGNGRLSPDGQIVFFNVEESSTLKWHIYKCNINGTNVQKIIDAGTANVAMIGGAY
jgi:hypothetical protein